MFVILFSTLSFNAALGADKKEKPVTVKFHVSGVCGMCESTIEKAMDVRGVIHADYNLEAHQLEVTYKPSKITEDEIHKLLNEVGYDTEKSICTDEQYARTHHCCKYRELSDH
mgnify:CR=1 FL=1